ncbi:MAG: CHAD domain protein [Chlorobi bacterium OLB5]|nr:MAG: CHAD domain protein [Chlorobi bacterium OLB5]
MGYLNRQPLTASPLIRGGDSPEKNMKRNYNIKKKLSLKENLRLVIPEMFGDFFVYADTVINFPLRKNELHEMRKAGKPLRYAMELGEYCFGADFSLCLNEIKSSLDLMGEIHDADVMIPDINLHMKEVRQFNNTITDNDQKLLTRQLRNTIEELKSSRRAMYAELCRMLNLWKENNFASRIEDAMKADLITEEQHTIAPYAEPTGINCRDK